MPTIDDLLHRVAGARARPPRHEAITAIRAVERALAEALDGQTLRGLPNLATRASPVQAANVRAASHNQAIAFPSEGVDAGPEALVLRPDGTLAIAWAARSRERPAWFEFLWRGAEDDDLRVEDLADLLRVLPKVLTDHLAVAERAHASWQRTRTLAHRVLDLLPTKG